MKISTSAQQRQLDALNLMIRDLAQQHEQIAHNQAELLRMILQLQMQIDELYATVPGASSPAT